MKHWQSRETGNTATLVYKTQDENKQKHNTLSVGYHYAQTHTKKIVTNTGAHIFGKWTGNILWISF